MLGGIHRAGFGVLITSAVRRNPEETRCVWGYGGKEGTGGCRGGAVEAVMEGDEGMEGKGGCTQGLWGCDGGG